MATRTTSVGTQTSSDFLTAAEYNSAAGGWIGYVAITSDVSGLTTSADDLTGLTVTVTVGADRYIKIHGHGRFTPSAADLDACMQIQESTTILNGSGGVNCWRVEADLAQGYGVDAFAVLADPTTGSHTYKLTGGLAAGSGTMKLLAAATRPAFIYVTDDGPA